MTTENQMPAELEDERTERGTAGADAAVVDTTGAADEAAAGRTEGADADASAVQEAGSDAEASDEGGSEEGAATGSTKREMLENEGEIAADYLEELLDIADLDGDIDTDVEGGRAHVSIVTEGDQLVGKNGEVLDALQELARMAVMAETGRRSRLMLDVAGHRDKRRVELEQLAKEAVAEVKETGEATRLTPMNPFERKIVHDVVADAGLISESEGEEPRRCVVVRPA